MHIWAKIAQKRPIGDTFRTPEFLDGLETIQEWPRVVFWHAWPHYQTNTQNEQEWKIGGKKKHYRITNKVWFIIGQAAHSNTLYSLTCFSQKKKPCHFNSFSHNSIAATVIGRVAAPFSLDRLGNETLTMFVSEPRITLPKSHIVISCGRSLKRTKKGSFTPGAYAKWPAQSHPASQ